MKYRIIEDGNGRFICQGKQNGWGKMWHEQYIYKNDYSLEMAKECMKEKIREREFDKNKEVIKKIVESE